MYEEREPIPELPSDLEAALSSEPEFVDISKPNNLADRTAHDALETVVATPSAQQSGKYEDHIGRDTHINITRKEKTERATDTRQFAIGQGERGEYSGQISMEYVVKNLVERHNVGLVEDDNKTEKRDGENKEKNESKKRIREGQYIQVIALGYRIGEKRKIFIREEDSIVAESSVYQVTRHPDGYLWSEPAVGMSEIAGDLLQGHPLAKDLSREERSKAQIWIQLAHIPDSEVIERVKLMSQGTATPLAKPEDAVGTLGDNFGDEADSTLESFFGGCEQEETPVQTKKPATARDLSTQLDGIGLKGFEF